MMVGGWGWGALVMLLFWVFLVAGVVWLAQRASSGGAESPRRILDERFARGEIDADEYRARREALGASGTRGWNTAGLVAVVSGLALLAILLLSFVAWPMGWATGFPLNASGWTSMMGPAVMGGRGPMMGPGTMMGPGEMSEMMGLMGCTRGFP